MLAGLIAYARKELPTAVQRFDRAYELDSSACDATWMSGLVSIDQNELAIAAPKFTRGMSCFVSSAAALRQDRARLEQAIRRAARRPPRVNNAQSWIGSPRCGHRREKSAQSAFNAAQCYARTGRKSMALNLMDVAIAHPRMNEKAVGAEGGDREAS